MAGSGRTGAGTPRSNGADPDARDLLEDIRDTMGLPWIPFPWEVYARQPSVLSLFWSRLRESTGSEVFLRESLAISGSVHMGVSAWYRPPQDVKLPGIGGDSHSLAHELDAFEFGYSQLLIQQAALVHLLRGLEVGVEGSALARSAPSPFRRPNLAYPAWEELDERTRADARDLRIAWSIPNPVADILALAKWPRFLARGMAELKAARLRPEYRTLRKRIADMGEDALARLRPRAGLQERELRAALEGSGAWPSGADRVKDQVHSFNIILPGMILDNALLRMAAASWRVPEEILTESP